MGFWASSTNVRDTITPLIPVSDTTKILVSTHLELQPSPLPDHQLLVLWHANPKLHKVLGCHASDPYHPYLPDYHALAPNDAKYKKNWCTVDHDRSPFQTCSAHKTGLPMVFWCVSLIASQVRTLALHRGITRRRRSCDSSFQRQLAAPHGDSAAPHLRDGKWQASHRQSECHKFWARPASRLIIARCYRRRAQCSPKCDV